MNPTSGSVLCYFRIGPDRTNMPKLCGASSKLCGFIVVLRIYVGRVRWSCFWACGVPNAPRAHLQWKTAAKLVDAPWPTTSLVRRRVVHRSKHYCVTLTVFATPTRRPTHTHTRTTHTTHRPLQFVHNKSNDHCIARKPIAGSFSVLQKLELAVSRIPLYATRARSSVVYYIGNSRRKSELDWMVKRE